MGQMRYRCPGAVPLGTAELEGYRLLFKGSKTGSYLTIEKADGYRVPVGVWSVTEDDEKRLDCFEGYPHFYYKTELDITYAGIKTVRKHRCRAFSVHHARGAPARNPLIRLYEHLPQRLR